MVRTNVRIKVFGSLFGIVLCGFSAAAAPLSPEWQPVPATNALRAVEDPAEWRRIGDAIVGHGRNWPWSWIVSGDENGRDYRLKATLTVRERIPPRGDRNEVHDRSDGRWRYWAGAYAPGCDAALLIRYVHPWHCYRVQFSVSRQEVILWKQFGGVLQVAPCETRLGVPFRVTVEAVGAHLTVSVDGEKKLDYWDRCLPELSGKIGLGVYSSKVAFSKIALTPLKVGPTPPPHVPKFVWQKWRGEYWLFDRGEPLLRWSSGKGRAAYICDVKLRRGYRPLFHTRLGWRFFYHGPTHSVITEDAAAEVDRTGHLRIRFKTLHPTLKIAADYAVTPEYEAGTGMYRYTVDTFLEALQALTDAVHMDPEFTDPITYNSKFPGKGVSHPWPFAGHLWQVGLNGGRWRRAPIHQELGFEGNGGPGNKHTIDAEGIFFLYPDMAACPAILGRNLERGWLESTCVWGFDYHCRTRLFTGTQNVPSGSSQRFSYVLTALPPGEAKRHFESAVLYATYQAPAAADLNAFPWGYPVWKPLSNNFAALTGVHEPHFDAAVTFGGGKGRLGPDSSYVRDYVPALDRTVGHGDTMSLVLHGPGSLGTSIKEYQQETFAAKYLLSAWVKTERVRGNGVALSASVAYPRPSKRKDLGKTDTFHVGLTGTHDWTRVNWVTSIFHDTEGCGIGILLDGSGTVWVDDVVLRPLKPHETLSVSQPAPWKPADDILLMDLRMDEGHGKGLYDYSRNRQYGRLREGCSWVREDGRWAVRFQSGGLSPAATARRDRSLSKKIPNAAKYYEHRWLKPGFSLEVWVKPEARSPNPEQTLMHDRESFYLKLLGTAAPYGLRATSMNEGGGTDIRVPPLIRADEWSHIAFVLDWEERKKACVFVNGKLVGEAPLHGPLWFFNWKDYYCIGQTWAYRGTRYSGLMRGLRMWGKALTQEEMIAAARE